MLSNLRTRKKEKLYASYIKLTSMNIDLNIEKNKMMIAEQKEARRDKSLVLFGLRAIEAPEALGRLGPWQSQEKGRET